MSKLKSKIIKLKCFRLLSNLLFVVGIVTFFCFSLSNHSSIVTIGLVSATLSVLGLVFSEIFEHLIKHNVKIYKNIKFRKQNNPVTIIEFKKIA